MIETERLTLRPFTEADRADYARIVADPQVADWLGGERVQAPSYFDAALRFWADHGYGKLALIRRADRRLIGEVGVRRVPMEWDHPMGGEVEVGWMLARDAWGAGYVTEAAAAALTWGRERLGVDQIHAWTSIGNERSQAVMRRLGMRRLPQRDFDFPGAAEDDPLRRAIVYITAAPSARS